VRLLIVEDNKRLAGLIAQGLRWQGFSFDVASDMATADASLESVPFDAVILDLGLPDENGITWLQHQRSPRQLIPALMLTACDGLEDRIAGLDSGADDNLVKPVDIEELAARVRALLRRPGPRAATMLEAGSLIFDPVSREAHCSERVLDLSCRETDLLELLMRRLGTVVVRDTIETTLYSFNEPVTPNAGEATVSRLRRELDEAGLAGQLQTVRGVGYMLRSN